MGVWDSGSFGNDTALDFVADLRDFKALRTTLSRFEKATGILDVDDASIALAACEVLAAIMGRPSFDLPKIPYFKKEDISDDLLNSTKIIIKHVRMKSELAELWKEEDETEWQSVLDGLLARLDPSKPYKAPKKKKRRNLPDDFLGHCYICYGEVTERNGIKFEHTMYEGITCSTHPHRKCIEKAISGPHWKKDGSPNAKTKKKLLRDMGIDI